MKNKYIEYLYIDSMKGRRVASLTDRQADKATGRQDNRSMG